MSKANMRVLTLGPLPPPPGGMASVVDGLDQALAKRLHHRVINNAKTTRANRSLFEAVGAQLALLLRYLSMMLFWRPHIVHIHTCSDPTFSRNALDVILAWMLFRRVVLHIHGGRFGQFLDGLTPRRARFVRWVFSLCRGVIVLGPVWEELLRPWVGDTPIQVVPNGVTIPGQGAKSPDIPKLVCIAGIERPKGQWELIQALSHLGDRLWTLSLVGPVVDERYLAELNEAIESAGIGDRVEFTGALDFAAKDAVLARSSLFVLPSHDEGLPMSMLESMAFALPVIMTRVGSIPDVIEDGVNGRLVAPRDEKALEQAIGDLLSDSAAMRSMGEKARVSVERDYGLERVADDLLAFYERLS